MNPNVANVPIVIRGTKFLVEPGLSLLEASRRAGVPLASACDGKMSCHLCQVRVLRGAENLSPAEDAERQIVGSRYAAETRRLGCQARITGPVTIEPAIGASVRDAEPPTARNNLSALRNLRRPK